MDLCSSWMMRIPNTEMGQELVLIVAISRAPCKFKKKCWMLTCSHQRIERGDMGRRPLHGLKSANIAHFLL